jgi:hypothetical protein
VDEHLPAGLQVRSLDERLPGGGRNSLNSPSRIFASSMFTLAAWMSTSTSRSSTAGSANLPACIGLLYLLTK